MNPSIQNILKFAEFLNNFRLIERKLLVNGQDRQENDAEHSYQLAMIAWYMVSTGKFILDINKVISYSLVHDIVETYAGDTSFFGRTDTSEVEKVEREEAALKRIEKEFTEFSELTALIHQYEKKEDDESKFVYALDKVQPIFNVYLDKRRTWKQNKVSFDMLISLKRKKLHDDTIVIAYFDEFMKIIETEKGELF